MRTSQRGSTASYARPLLQPGWSCGLSGFDRCRDARERSLAPVGASLHEMATANSNAEAPVSRQPNGPAERSAAWGSPDRLGGMCGAKYANKLVAADRAATGA